MARYFLFMLLAAVMTLATSCSSDEPKSSEPFSREFPIHIYFWTADGENLLEDMSEDPVFDGEAYGVECLVEVEGEVAHQKLTLIHYVDWPYFYTKWINYLDHLPETLTLTFVSHKLFGDAEPHRLVINVMDKYVWHCNGYYIIGCKDATFDGRVCEPVYSGVIESCIFVTLP